MENYAVYTCVGTGYYSDSVLMFDLNKGGSHHRFLQATEPNAFKVCSVKSYFRDGRRDCISYSFDRLRWLFSDSINILRRILPWQRQATMPSLPWPIQV